MIQRESLFEKVFNLTAHTDTRAQTYKHTHVCTSTRAHTGVSTQTHMHTHAQTCTLSLQDFKLLIFVANFVGVWCAALGKAGGVCCLPRARLLSVTRAHFHVAA